MKAPHLLLGILAFTFLCCSCASQHIFKGKPTYTDSNGETYCSVHSRKLISARGYSQSSGVCILPTEKYLKWASAFPNHNTEIANEKSELYDIPIKFRYCEACRQDLAEKLAH